MEHKEGKLIKSKTVSSYGKTKSHIFENSPANDECIQQQVIGLEYIAYSEGFTKETNEWEFARLDIRIGVFMPDELDYDKVYESIKRVVKELISVENDSLNGIERLPEMNSEDLDLLNECYGRSISLTYGLTMKSKDRDSEKVDVTRSKYVDDGIDIIDAYYIISDWVLSSIEEEYRRVKEKPLKAIR